MTARAKSDVSAIPDAKFRQGVGLHQQGKLAEAARLYQDILQQAPAHFDAMHLLGVVALQTGQHRQSVELITRALKLSPSAATAHANLGSALMGLQRFAEALQSFDKAIALKSDLVEAHANRAAALNQLKRPADALASCEKAIALKQDFAEAHNNRANALNALRRYEDALASCDKAIGLKPNYAEAHNNRGIALNALTRFDEAVASYDKAIALRPGYVEAYNNRGNALYNLARADEALASYDKAIALKPDYAEAHNNRGSALTYLKRHDEALASYDRAIALKPDHVDAYFNKSLLLLRLGRFGEGWALYEWRKKKSDPFAARGSTKPLWLGEQDLAGKTLLLHEEQGLGDTLQFCRYAKLAADRGARVILEVPKALTRLLGGLAGVDQVVEAGGYRGDFDYHCPLMSLPLAFKTTLPTIPASIPYLKADPEKARYWKEKLGQKTRPRVGLVWSGGFRADQPETWPVNKRRNIPLSKLAPLKHPGIAFYSLQKGQPGESELDELLQANWDGPELLNFTGALKDFSDTAALIENFDLVISVDTSTAHLAGALGKRVWLLNRFDTCWRWLPDRTDSPWYPTATLYTQEKPGDWDGVVARVRADLFRFASS